LVLQLEGLASGRLPRAIAVVLVEALALLALLGIFLLLVPILVREWPLLQQQLPLLLDRLGDAINPLLAQLGLLKRLWQCRYRRRSLHNFPSKWCIWMICITDGMALSERI
jgi:predicted PurR-regulated permease PerM